MRMTLLLISISLSFSLNLFCSVYWEILPKKGAPIHRGHHSITWTGSKFLVWGGRSYGGLGAPALNDGATFDMKRWVWEPTAMEGTLIARSDHSAVWTGTDLIIWGGANSNLLASGARYNPKTRKWNSISTIWQPEPRFHHTAVMAHEKMYLWGGTNLYQHFSNGFSYDPPSDTWEPLASNECFSARMLHSMTFIPELYRIFFFGGRLMSGSAAGDGAFYGPIVQGNWDVMWLGNSPSNRFAHSAVWTGNHLLIWGGYGKGYLGDGYLYDPRTGKWKQISHVNAPSPRWHHLGIWTGKRFIVFGGMGGNSVEGSYLNDGGSYDPSTDTWESLPPPPAGFIPRHPQGAWGDGALFIWGGKNNEEQTFGDGVVLHINED